MKINIDDFLGLYYQGLSDGAVAKNFNVDASAVAYHRRKLGLPTNKHRVCYVNHSYFKTWSSNMAYILGYIATDGCIAPKNRLKIGSVDREILEKISKELNSTHKINAYVYKKYLSYQIQICSNEIYSDLTNLGITPNKSYNIRFPNVPKEYLSHFIRGVFDGDGCVVKATQRSLKQKECISVWISFVSASIQFIESLKFELNSFGLLGGHIYLKKPSPKNKQRVTCYELCFRKYDSIKFYNIIYSDSLIFLQRKKEKFDKILTEVV
jgi:hypothetical protein